MLTKKDYIGYLSDIEKIERTMLSIYTECFNRVEDKTMKAIFDGLRKEESGHEKILKLLKDILEK